VHFFFFLNAHSLCLENHYLCFLLSKPFQKIFKRVKKAWKHGKDQLGRLCDEEFVDIGTSERTIKEKLKCTLFSDYEGLHLYM